MIWEREMEKLRVDLVSNLGKLDGWCVINEDNLEKVSLVFKHIMFSTSKIFKWRFPVRNMLGKPKG